MPSAEDNYKLLWGIIMQKMNGGVLEGIDWASIGIFLNPDEPVKANTVNKRFSSLKAEFAKLGFPNTAKSSGAAGRASKGAAKPKTANPKARAAITKPKTPIKGRGKKAQAAIKDEDEDEELGDFSAMDEDLDSNIDERAENGGQGYQEMDHEEELEEEDA